MAAALALLALACEAAEPAAAPGDAAGSCSVAPTLCPGRTTRTFCPTNPDRLQCTEAACSVARQPCPPTFPNGAVWCPALAIPMPVQCEGVPAGPPNVTVHSDTVTHQISELVMGCHSDKGYEHQARGFYAQMIVPDSFNATGFTPSPHWGGNASTDGSFSSARVGWNVEKSAPSVTFTHGMDTTSRFHGVASERLSLTGRGSGGLSNRGLGNAGLVFEAGKPYEGFIWAAAGETSGVSVTVSLEDYTSTPKKVLATQTFTVQAGTGESTLTYARYNFTLTPSASTRCVGIPYRFDPLILCGSHAANVSPRSFAADEKLGHICVRCGGQFKVSLSQVDESTAGATDGTVAALINYAYLQPGQWGRVPGLPVLASAAATLKAMGVKAIRDGGSYASSPSAQHDLTYYQWQKWTGPAWTRPSRTNGIWGLDLISGWGPFEMIDMCNALGIEPVITTTDTSSAASFADLVEYCYGNDTTPQGKKRVADGHPEQYRVKYFELGNEQYNPNYVQQVEVMEKKARELGIGKTLYYMFPKKTFLSDADIKKAVALTPRVDSQMVADLHVGAGGAVGVAERLFQSANITKAGLKMGAVNAETNANTHAFHAVKIQAIHHHLIPGGFSLRDCLCFQRCLRQQT